MKSSRTRSLQRFLHVEHSRSGCCYCTSYSRNVRFLFSLFLLALLSMPLHIRYFRCTLCLRLSHGDLFQPLDRMPVVERPVGNGNLRAFRWKTQQRNTTGIRSPKTTSKNKTAIISSYQQCHNEARQPSIHRVSEVSVHVAHDPRDDLLSTTNTQPTSRQ